MENIRYSITQIQGFALGAINGLKNIYTKAEIDAINQAGIEFCVQVDTFADLPVTTYENGTALENGDLAFVRKSSGVYALNRKPNGVYMYNLTSLAWEISADYNYIISELLKKVNQTDFDAAIVETKASILSLQNQISTKENIITTLPIEKGGTNSSTALAGFRAIVSNGSAFVESSITSAEIGYLNGVTSSIQPQINLKINTSDIKDNLTSTDTNKPLSANQGKVLNDTKINNIEDWLLANSYKKYQPVKYIDNNVYYANADIPANTAFVIGFTGQTWQQNNSPVILNYDITLAYAKGEVIYYTDKSYYISNDFIPANTPFVIGTSGATWKLFIIAAQPEYGQNTSITGSTITGVTATDINGSAFTLPSTGTWEVSYNIQYATSQTSQNCVIFCSDSSNNFILGSNYNMYVANVNPTGVVNNAHMTFRITTTGVQTFKLRANAGSASATVSIISTTTPSTGTNGSSGIYWKKISGFTFTTSSPSNIKNWSLTESVNANDVKLNNGFLYRANSDISANTPFVKGTTGQTWANILRWDINNWNVDLSNGETEKYDFYNDYVIFAGGTLTLAQCADFPNIALVNNITEARRLIPRTQDAIHRLLIGYGGENDTTWDQLANINYNSAGTFALANNKIGGLSIAVATDVDESATGTLATEYFMCPFARDATNIYFITACYTIVPTYTPSFGNKTVQFYTGGDGSGTAAPTANNASNTTTLASLRYTSSFAPTTGISLLLPLRFKYKNG